MLPSLGLEGGAVVSFGQIKEKRKEKKRSGLLVSIGHTGSLCCCVLIVIWCTSGKLNKYVIWCLTTYTAFSVSNVGTSVS